MIGSENEGLKTMMKAAEAMGVAEGRQNFKNASVYEFHLVDYFSTFFGEWTIQDKHILVHLFPRAGEADVWYEARYTNNGRTYVPGRKEFCPRGLFFPSNMRKIIEESADKITFGDVELTQVNELQAWAIRFRDAEPLEDWLKEGGFLEQFFRGVDEGIERARSHGTR